MFHWICPECGREIAPAVKECPVCDPASAESAPATPVAAPRSQEAVAVLTVPAVEVKTAPAAEPRPAAPANGHGVATKPRSHEAKARLSSVPSAAPRTTPQTIEVKAIELTTVDAIPEPVARPAVQTKTTVQPEPAKTETISAAEAPQTKPEAVPEPAIVAPVAAPTARVEPAIAEKIAEPVVAPPAVEVNAAETSEVKPPAFPEPVTAPPAAESHAVPVLAAADHPTTTIPQAEPAAIAEPVAALQAKPPAIPEPIPAPPLTEAAKPQSEPVKAETISEPAPAPPAIEAKAAEPQPPTIAAAPVIEVKTAPDQVAASDVPETVAEETKAEPTPAPAAVAEITKQAATEPAPKTAPTEIDKLTDGFADRLAALAEQLRAGHIPYPRPEGTAPRMAAPPAAPLPAPSPEIAPRAAKPVALLSAPPITALLPEMSAPAVASRVNMGDTLLPRVSGGVQWAPRGLAGSETLTGGIVRTAPRPTPIASPGLAGLTNYAAAAVKIARAIPPANKVMAVDTAPRVTLPGPTLPRELTSLQAAGLGTIMSGKPRRSGGRGVPGWLVSLLVMAVLLGTGFGVVFYAMPGILASSAPAKTDSSTDTAPAVSYPLAKNVEVTGFRFVVDNAKKSEIHYLVVNHSNTILSGMTIFVTLHSAHAKPGQPPLSRFSFPAPNLGPFESREMTSPIEKVTRPLDLPDWQDLRTQVEIGQ